MEHIGRLVRMSVSGYRGRRFEPRHQIVVSLSKTLYLHCLSRLSCKMRARWGEPREGCSVLRAFRRNSTWKSRLFGGYMHTYMHMHTSIHTHLHTYIYVHTEIHMNTYAYIYIYMQYTYIQKIHLSIFDKLVIPIIITLTMNKSNKHF